MSPHEIRSVVVLLLLAPVILTGLLFAAMGLVGMLFGLRDAPGRLFAAAVLVGVCAWPVWRALCVLEVV